MTTEEAICIILKAITDPDWAHWNRNIITEANIIIDCENEAYFNKLNAGVV